MVRVGGRGGSVTLTACEQGRRVRYATTAQLVNELAEAADNRQLSRVVGRYGRLDLLLLDERRGAGRVNPRTGTDSVRGAAFDGAGAVHGSAALARLVCAAHGRLSAAGEGCWASGVAGALVDGAAGGWWPARARGGA